ncbi:MAG: acyltransferase [Planctomycetota bacterium]
MNPRKQPVGFCQHPQALVEEGARIGEGTRVWAFAHVMSGAEVGRHCNLGNHSFIESGARLGDHVTVKNGVQVWEGVVAEDRVFLGPSCVLTNDLRPRSGSTRTKEEWLTPILLKEGCSIGASATILCGNSVGRYALVGAGALVTRSVPDFALVRGAPARVHGWVCRCASPLEFVSSQASCSSCGYAYLLDEEGLRVTESRVSAAEDSAAAGCHSKKARRDRRKVT